MGSIGMKHAGLHRGLGAKLIWSRRDEEGRFTWINVEPERGDGGSFGGHFNVFSAWVAPMALRRFGILRTSLSVDFWSHRGQKWAASWRGR